MIDGDFGRYVSFVLAIVLNVLLAAIGIWDCLCWWQRQPSWTVTAVVQDWVRELPLLALLAGLVLGHLFFPTQVVPPPLK